MICSQMAPGCYSEDHSLKLSNLSCYISSDFSSFIDVTSFFVHKNTGFAPHSPATR